MGERVQFRMEIDGKFGLYEGEIIRQPNGEIWLLPDDFAANPGLGDSHLLDPAMLLDLPQAATGTPQYRYRGVVPTARKGSQKPATTPPQTSEKQFSK